MYHSVRYSVEGLDTSPDQMALDIIRKVGPRGHFLREKHTREYFRKLNFSDIVHVPDVAGTYRDPIEVARKTRLDFGESPPRTTQRNPTKGVDSYPCRSRARIKSAKVAPQKNNLDDLEKE